MKRGRIGIFLGERDQRLFQRARDAMIERDCLEDPENVEVLRHALQFYLSNGDGEEKP